MLMNEITTQWINAYINHPKSAVIVASEDVLSQDIVIDYLHDKLIGQHNNPYVRINSEEKNTIGVEKIRELKKQLSLQANTSTNAISRMIVIEQANQMTDEAQNALLKLIEELPGRTTICLTVQQSSDLLPTVASRCYLIRVLPLEKAIALKYAESTSVSTQEAQKMYAMSSGYPGLFDSLVKDESNAMVESISEAKTFLTSTIFERQKCIATLVKNPEKIPMQLKAMRTIALSGLRTSDAKTKFRWKKTIEQVAITERHIAANVSTKLALLRLSITI